MGLDNGIRLRTKERNLQLPEYVEADIQEKENFIDIDLCYWRKCWNIRNSILAICDINNIKADEKECYYDLNLNALKEIKEELTAYLSNGDKWDDSNDSIWSFNEMKYKIANDIINIDWAIKYLSSVKNAYAYFYDSY